MIDRDFFQKIKKEASLKATKAQVKKIRQYLGTKDENAEEVYEDPFNTKERTYVWDSELADSEIIPWKDNQEEYLANNVAPYAPDYHVDEEKTRIGYEIPFTREFYRYTPLKPSSEIFQTLKDLEKDLYSFSILTNGTLITDEIARRISEYNPEYVQVSLEGGKKTNDYIRGKKGVFKRCINALNKCSKAGFYTSAVSSIHKKNINELDKILEILIDNGVRAWQIQTATPQGRMPKELALDEEEFYYLAKYIAQKRREYANIIDIYEADCIGYYSVLSKDF